MLFNTVRFSLDARSLNTEALIQCDNFIGGDGFGKNSILFLEYLCHRGLLAVLHFNRVVALSYVYKIKDKSVLQFIFGQGTSVHHLPLLITQLDGEFAAVICSVYNKVNFYLLLSDVNL